MIMKKIIFILTLMFSTAIIIAAQDMVIMSNIKHWDENCRYLGNSTDDSFITIINNNGTLQLSFIVTDINNNYFFYYNAHKGSSKIEMAQQNFTFNGFDLTDAKVISDLESSDRFIIARIGGNVFFGEYDPKSRVFNKAAIVDSEYAPQVDKAINDAISQGILISYLKPVKTPEETQPVKPRQPVPHRPASGSTPKTK